MNAAEATHRAAQLLADSGGLPLFRIPLFRADDVEVALGLQPRLSAQTQTVNAVANSQPGLWFG